jgi:hypothetical protein
MPGGFIVLMVLLGGLWFFRQAGRLSPKQVRIFSTRVFGAGLMIVGAFLALHGGVVMAIPVFAAGAGLFGLTKFLPQNVFAPVSGKAAPPAAGSPMDRAEALSVLGLNVGASREDIIAAHKRLQRTNHPDVGGSTYLAGKINQARDVLLKT